MNKNPVLLCTGTCKTIVSHTFAGEVEDKNYSGDTLGFAQMFECDYCGKKRRFGYTAWGCSQGTAKWGTRIAEAS